MVGDGRDTLLWYDNWVGDIPLRIKYPRLFELAVDKESKVGDMGRLGWDGDGRVWVWRRCLFTWEEESVRKCSILICNVVLQDNVQDYWRWMLDHVHGYLVKAAYHYITYTSATSDRSRVDTIWLKHIPSKVSLLVWRLFQNRLPTKDNLVRRGILLHMDGACAVSCDIIESASQLFLHCSTYSQLWSNVRNWFDIYSVSSGELRHHFIQFTKDDRNAKN